VSVSFAQLGPAYEGHKVSIGAYWGASSILLGPLGRVLGRSWGLLGHLGSLLGRSWGHLGRVLGPLGGILGPSWGRRNVAPGYLKSRHLSVLILQGFPNGTESLLESLGGILGRSWQVLGRFLRFLGRFLEPSWAVLGSLGVVLGGLGGQSYAPASVGPIFTYVETDGQMRRAHMSL